jgi:DNA polymerase III subunit delta
MNPAQFMARTKKTGAPAAALLIGPESYDRRRIKEALTAGFPEGSVAEHDLMETSLADVVDDARSLSLFASERLVWVANAEAALPRGKAAAAEEDEGEGAPGDASILADYLRDPTPGVSLIFEAARFDFDGDDKRKQERVRKFYAGVGEVVDLRRYSADDALGEARTLARGAGLRLDASALGLLVEALGADMARIATEIEKLALYAGSRELTADDIAALAPEARATTIFALVGALGRRDRTRALEILDVLAREGEYLPLALSFLSTQFRMALAAREAGLRSPQQIQSHFTKMGLPVWSSRAEQIHQTASRFGGAQLKRALLAIYEADKGLRDARPDDRIVMEKFVLKLTA